MKTNLLIERATSLRAAFLPSSGDASPFDPGLRRMAAFLPRGAVSSRSLPLVRRLMVLGDRRASTGVDVVPAGPVSMRIHRPKSSSSDQRPGLLWIHGGGYVIGSAAQDDAICRHFARELDCVVAAVDYRLAPEHPFPTPLDDCHDALVALADLPEVDTTRIAIGGASAGGGLAAALTFLALDRGVVQPVVQILGYPMLDDRTVLRRDLDESHMRLWNNTSNAFGWQAYTGHAPGSADIDPLAAPARRAYVGNLPATWIGVGTEDLFHDECVAYADRLQASSVDCELDVAPGAFHGFDMVAPTAAVSKAFRASQVAALRRGFSSASA